jgi:hypothetical protein
VEYPNTGDSDILGLKACMQNVLEEISWEAINWETSNEEQAHYLDWYAIRPEAIATACGPWPTAGFSTDPFSVSRKLDNLHHS